MLRMESPPSWKKLSAIETPSRRRISPQISASARSVPVSGSTRGAPGRGPLRSGSGLWASARRSTLPLPVSGNPGTATKAAGIM